MTKKTNGATPPDDPKDKIIQFRTLAEQDRARKEKLKEEKRWQKQYKTDQHTAAGPMFNFGNITPFAKYFTFMIVLVNIPLYLNDALKLKAIYALGFIPFNFTQSGEQIYHLHTILTHTLIHDDWMHLTFNAIMLLALGTFFERLYGTKTTLIFFGLCALAGALTYTAIAWDSRTPMIGASAGISGLFAAALMSMYSNRQIQMPGRKTFGPWGVVMFWLVLMVVIGFLAGGHIAWHAHIGGFLAGAFLYQGLQKGKIRF